MLFHFQFTLPDLGMASHQTQIDGAARHALMAGDQKYSYTAAALPLQGLKHTQVELAAARA